MSRVALAMLAVMFAVGVASALRIRAQWIEQKISAAVVAPQVRGPAGPACPQGNKQTILIGDSRVAQWPMRLFGGLPIANRGLPGETALQLTSRFDRDVSACHPGAVLIATGINDLVAASLAPQPQAGEIVSRLPDLLIALAEKAAQAGAAVSVATIIPPAPPDLLRRVVWSGSIRGYVLDVNARLRAYPWPGGVTLVDFAAALEARDTGLLQSRFRRDTLHLNSLAYERLTPVLLLAASIAEGRSIGLVLDGTVPSVGRGQPTQ